MAAQSEALPFGQAGVVYTVAVADQPLTVAEIRDRAGVSLTPNAFATTARRAWRRGFLARRKREIEGRGNNPYEYTLAPPDEGGETHDE